MGLRFGVMALLAVQGLVPSLTALPAGAQQNSQQNSQQNPQEASPILQDAYVLGPGDRVELTVLDPGARELSGTFDILNDGSASFALLGSVVLAGLTLNQAQVWLQSLYERYLLRPDLNVRLVQARPMQVSVVGEVENPGLYFLSIGGEGSLVEGASESVPGLPTVVTAIQKAGGFTLSANLTDVRLQRRIPGDNQQLRETQLNLVSLLRLGDKAQNPFLFDGDTLVVSSAPMPDQEVIELAAANLSPQSIAVTVVGEVVSPGRLALPAKTPAVQAILAAGGPTNWRGKRSDVELVRINRNGTATRQFLSVDYTQGVSGTRNPLLRDGDTLVVNRTSYAVATDALGAVAAPLTGLVNIWALVRLVQDN